MSVRLAVRRLAALAEYAVASDAEAGELRMVGTQRDSRQTRHRRLSSQPTHERGMKRTGKIVILCAAGAAICIGGGAVGARIIPAGRICDVRCDRHPIFAVLADHQTWKRHRERDDGGDARLVCEDDGLRQSSAGAGLPALRRSIAQAL